MKLSREDMELLGLAGCSGPETMGLFGLSWPEKVASFMYKQLKGSAAAKKLKQFWGAGGKNVTLVKNLHNEYMAFLARGYNASNFTIPPDANGKGGSFDQNTTTLAGLIQQKTNVSIPIILEFLRAMFVLARDGKIPFKKWNPKGYQQSTDLRKSFQSEKGVLEAAQATGNVAKMLVVLAGLGVGAYIITQLKGFKK